MIRLSTQQMREYGIPLIIDTMGFEIGEIAEDVWNNADDGETTDMWGIFEGDELIALTGLGAEMSKTKVWLGYLAVAKRFRRKGLGRMLLRFAEKLARDRGYKRMFIETYDHSKFDSARDMYRHEGYGAVGFMDGELDSGTRTVYYAKRL